MARPHLSNRRYAFPHHFTTPRFLPHTQLSKKIENYHCSNRQANMLVPYWPSSKLAQRQRNVALAYSNNHEKKKVSRPARSSSPSFIRSKNIRHSLLEAKGQRIFIKPLRASTVGLASTPVTLYRASHRRDCFLRCQSLCRGDTANQDSNGFVCVQSNVGVPRHRIPGPADRRAKVIIKPRHCLGSPSFMR